MLPGCFVVPVFISKRLHFKFEPKTGATPGTPFDCKMNGRITSDVFVLWLKHFIQTIKRDKETNILLLQDGHVTHRKNIVSFNLTRQNGVILLYRRAQHTTYRLQPLGMVFFGYFQRILMRHETDGSAREYRVKTITWFQTSELLGSSCGRTNTVANSGSGFATRGFWEKTFLLIYFLQLSPQNGGWGWGGGWGVFSMGDHPLPKLWTAFFLVQSASRSRSYIFAE
jgi:hypothetical protein